VARSVGQAVPVQGPEGAEGDSLDDVATGAPAPLRPGLRRRGAGAAGTGTGAGTDATQNYVMNGDIGDDGGGDSSGGGDGDTSGGAGGGAGSSHRDPHPGDSNSSSDGDGGGGSEPNPADFDVSAALRGLQALVRRVDEGVDTPVAAAAEVTAALAGVRAVLRRACSPALRRRNTQALVCNSVLAVGGLDTLQVRASD
jgi:hypothetical protein